MRVFLVALVFVSIAGTASSAHGQKSDKIPVFVRAAASAEGFTDPSKERQDSMKDLSDKVRGSKTLSLATSEKDAVVILEVLARTTRREVNGWALVGGSAQNKSRLEVRLIAGEFSTEFGADGGSSGVFTGYGKAAANIVKQVETWAKDNHDKLTAGRDKGGF